MKADLRCSKADFQPSISSIGTSVSFISTDGSSHTLGPLLGTIMMQLALLSSGREDERFTVKFETNMSLAVDSVRLWSDFQAGRVVVDGEKWLNALRCCASEGCRTAKFSFTCDVVQTPSASMWLAACD